MAYRSDEGQQSGAGSTVETPLLSEDQRSVFYGATTPTLTSTESAKLDEDPVASMDILTDPDHPQSPYYEGKSPELTSLPLLVSPQSNSNDIFTPIVRKTTENLNSVGRKVSGFLRKSIDTLHSDTPTSPSRKTINATMSPIVSADSQDHLLNDEEVIEYVSFGSINDGANNFESAKSNPASNYGVELTPTLSNNTVTSGLGILTPLMGKKSRKPSSNNVKKPLQLFSDGAKHPPFKPLRNFSAASLNSVGNSNGNINGNATGNPNGSHLSISPKTKASRSGLSLKTNSNSQSENSSTEKSNHDVEEEYNINNSYNYSLSNTIEEIQNQLNYYNQQTGQPRLGSSVSFGANVVNPNLSKSTPGKMKYSSIDSNTQSHNINTTSLNMSNMPGHSRFNSINSNSANPYANTPILPPPPTSRKSLGNPPKIVGKKRRNFTTTTLTPRRALSYEQHELLNELNK
ncbi:unnamed protein product [Ambrosiozyma monospora]|uniref:Unnamed protein product n=1 Tax=Ambrosiozyma monospora TaxID=43982 RepID=A0ACB5T1E3_AMBMO|nr:unnamed protein product [Ambrosiozyma monospora]